MRRYFSLYGCIYAIILACMLAPSYILKSTLLENSMVLVVGTFLLCKRYTPSRFVIMMFVYYLYVITQSFLLGTRDIHLITYNFKIIALVAVIDMMIQINKEKAIEILYWIVLLFCFFDFFSIILFPNGLYQTTTRWNEWSYSTNNYWIFGHKNNHAIWFILLGLLTFMHTNSMGKRKARKLCFAYAFISVTSMLIVKSSTSLIVVLLISLAFFKTRFGKQYNRNYDTKILLYGAMIINVLVIIGATFFLKPIVEVIFKKDLTFSGRTIAWQNALLLIAQKPIFGWGVISESDYQRILGSIAFVNIHNQILQCLFQGGIVLLIYVALLFVNVANSINLEQLYTNKMIKMACFGGLLLELVFEVRLDSQLTWILLLVLSQVIYDSRDEVQISES